VLISLPNYAPKQATQRRAKAKALSTFARFTRASQLVAAAGAARLWAARPLALAHAYAWRGDTLHAAFHLLWWRWRDRAVGRLRFRAFLAAHMRRCGRV